ncbi:hypothetical protein [Paenibacillus dendritiformis]|uniref:hypothetical protein n=1 Tax=Paenibacillus dendritiformis TaxID=130049 RepID=UPI0018CF8130|nr:hypothetical protein [Paenibacillus dendritiformis]
MNICSDVSSYVALLILLPVFLLAFLRHAAVPALRWFYPPAWRADCSPQRRRLLQICSISPELLMAKSQSCKNAGISPLIRLKKGKLGENDALLQELCYRSAIASKITAPVQEFLL